MRQITKKFRSPESEASHWNKTYGDGYHYMLFDPPSNDHHATADHNYIWTYYIQRGAEEVKEYTGRGTLLRMRKELAEELRAQAEAKAGLAMHVNTVSEEAMNANPPKGIVCTEDAATRSALVLAE
jgi:hypothetical protein